MRRIILTVIVDLIGGEYVDLNSMEEVRNLTWQEGHALANSLTEFLQEEGTFTHIHSRVEDVAIGSREIKDVDQ